MPRMIELIRQNAVPANMMRAAARGSLSLPPAETIEILVHLSEHPFFGEQARLTLAGWDEKSSLEVACDPQTPPPVLNYLSAPTNLRPKLVPALVSNPRVPTTRVAQIAEQCSREILGLLLESERVRISAPVLRAMLKNLRLSSEQKQTVDDLLAGMPDPTESNEIEDAEVARFLQEHGAEIAAEDGKPYVLLGASELEQAELAATRDMPGASTGDAAADEALRALSFGQKHEYAERVSVVQRIAKMTVGERVQLALKGNKDERFLLIRDGARIVARAVLESPKLTDAELDQFAAMKNVNESILRTLGTKQKFLKRYSVIRILTMNPKTPIDVSLDLVPRLLMNDLRHLTRNRDVSDTVVKFAQKLYRLRSTSRQQ